MGKILRNKSCILGLFFLLIFAAAATAAPVTSKNRKSARTEYRYGSKNLKGICNCYKDRNYKKKTVKPSAKYIEFQRRNHYASR